MPMRMNSVSLLTLRKFKENHDFKLFKESEREEGQKVELGLLERYR